MFVDQTRYWGNNRITDNFWKREIHFWDIFCTHIMSHNYSSNENTKTVIIIVEQQDIPKWTLESLEHVIADIK